MKRWLWLLAMPYVVHLSSNAPCPDCRDEVADSAGLVWSQCWKPMGCGEGRYEIVLSTGLTLGCDMKTNCDWLFDAAEALNAAHERRANTR